MEHVFPCETRWRRWKTNTGLHQPRALTAPRRCHILYVPAYAHPSNPGRLSTASATMISSSSRLLDMQGAGASRGTRTIPDSRAHSPQRQGAPCPLHTDAASQWLWPKCGSLGSVMGLIAQCSWSRSTSEMRTAPMMKSSRQRKRSATLAM